MAPRKSENEKELADRERLMRMWRRYHVEQLEQALAGIHSDVMKRLMAQLEDLRSARALKWGHDNKPLETKILAPGERFLDFEKLNAACPQSEWRMSFGKKVGPWSGQHYNPYTWASPITTVGSAIAVRELANQIKRVRTLRDSDNVYPVVELGHTHFPNRYKPDRERPDLRVERWVTLGADRTANVLPPPTTATLPDSGSAPAASGSAPAATQGAPADAQPVAPVTLKEEMQDEIP